MLMYAQYEVRSNRYATLQYCPSSRLTACDVEIPSVNIHTHTHTHTHVCTQIAVLLTLVVLLFLSLIAYMIYARDQVSNCPRPIHVPVTMYPLA